jgi:hypothetical protein
LSKPQPSGLQCNLSLPTSDTLAKLPPQLKPPLLEASIPTIPTAPVVPLSVEQQAAVLIAVHQNDNVKPPGILQVQSLKEGKVSNIILRTCRHHQCRHYHPRARHGHYRQRHCRYRCRYRRLSHCKGASYLCKTSPWRNASQSIIEADTPALVVIPAAKWNGNSYSVICQVQTLKEGKVSDIILQTCRHHITALELDTAMVNNVIADTVTINSAIAKAHHTFARPPPGEMVPSQSLKHTLQPSLSFRPPSGMVIILLSPVKCNL